MIPLPILSVSQLNRQVRSWLEHEMGVVSVEGEISNLIKPTSGHYYFTLKDAQAQIRCVYFRNHHKNSTTNGLQNGQHVLISGTLSLYEARGDYQLIVQDLEDAGQGDLFQQFERLKIKLSALGLFEATRKKKLPSFPTCIGIITSPTGAALHDIQSTILRRFPIVKMQLYPTEVQGKQAAQHIISAIGQANAHKICDVLILARGGGSLEDLWPFNDEGLAVAIAQSRIPIVTGIGHETDFTIADFVADFRAATPTAAAETVTPNLYNLNDEFQALTTRLHRAIVGRIRYHQLILQHQIQKITSPKQVIRHHWQTLDFMQNQLHQAIQLLVVYKQNTIQLSIAKLEKFNPLVHFIQVKTKLNQLDHHLFHLMNSQIKEAKEQFISLLATLETVSPLATLHRGYAIVTRHQHVINDTKEIKIGDEVNITFAKGRLIAMITGKPTDDSPR